jgi:hypothetical protein
MYKRLTCYAVLATSFGLSACAGPEVSIKAEPVASDMPMPKGARLCSRTADKLGRLDGNDFCLAPVIASYWLSRVPIEVRADEEYCIEAIKDQIWYDATNANVPPHGFKGSATMNVLASQRRQQEAEWFNLFGAVVSQNPSAKTEYGPVDLEKQHCIKVPQSAPQDAVLALYPNDAKDFYWNNHGRIWVWVARCDGRRGTSHCPVDGITSLLPAQALK